MGPDRGEAEGRVMQTFTNGQRVITAAGLPWLPIRRTGTVIQANSDGKGGARVQLDHPLKGRSTIFLLNKNMEAL